MVDFSVSFTGMSCTLPLCTALQHVSIYICRFGSVVNVFMSKSPQVRPLAQVELLMN